MEDAGSPLVQAVAQVGDRWTLLLVDALLGGPRRFNELAEDVPGIAPNILTQRLRHLEREGLVVARPYSERPRRSVYELTAPARQLAGAIRLLADWGARGRDAHPEALRHAACGSRLETLLFCPRCDRPVDDSEAAELHFV